MNSLSQPRQKISRQFEALAHFKEHGWNYPLSAEIDLTWRCSLSCKGCHSKWLHASVELNQSQIYVILSQLKEHGCKSVTWSGGGDPMESPHFEYAVNLAHDMGLEQALYSWIPKPTQETVRFLDSKMSFTYSHPLQTKGLKRTEFHTGNHLNTWTVGYLLDVQNWYKAGEYAEKTDFHFFDHLDFRPLCPENTLDPKPLNYSWIKEALPLLSELRQINGKVTFADYKFLDLLRSDFGRTYKQCLSTDFTAVIGPDGSMYECVQRRGITSLGNIITEGLEAVWKRKAHSREDMSQCRVLCRNHENNKELYSLFNPMLHEAFV